MRGATCSARVSPRGAAGAEGSGAEREQQLRVGHRDRRQTPGGHGAAAGHGPARAAQTGWYTCHVTTCQAPSCRTLDVPRSVYPFHSLNYFKSLVKYSLNCVHHLNVSSLYKRRRPRILDADLISDDVVPTFQEEHHSPRCRPHSGPVEIPSYLLKVRSKEF